MDISREPDALRREYELALRTGDLISQYEILRLVQENPFLYDVIEKAEAEVLADASVPEPNWSLIRSSIRAESRTARVFRVWEAVIQTIEPIIRYVVSLWPPIAAIILVGITYTVVTRADAPRLAPVLLLLGLAILGSVVVLCATNMWNPVWRDSGKSPRRDQKANRARVLIPAVAVGVASGAACAMLVVWLWLARAGVIYPTILVRTSGYFNSAGVAEVPLRLSRVEPGRDAKYVLVVWREGSRGPITVNLYDETGRLVARDSSEGGAALLDLRPGLSMSYKMRLEVWGAANPIRVKWQTKILEFDAADISGVTYRALVTADPATR